MLALSIALSKCPVEQGQISGKSLCLISLLVVKGFDPIK